MRTMKTLRAAAAALLTLTLCVWGQPSACAVSGAYDAVKGQDCTLTVEYAPDNEPMANNIFRIWKVGTLTEGGTVGGIGGYNVLNGEGTWLDKAGTLLGYLQRDNVAPTASASTDGEGKVRFEIPAADQGLYLVAGDSQYRDKTRYTPTPFLIMVPCTQDLKTWETDVETYSKFTAYTPGPDAIQRHVLKSWKDSGHEHERPAEIVVDLLRDGQVYDTVTLTASGSWRWDWTGLDPQYEWKVVEREHGRYSVLVEQEGITFHITNTWQTPPDPTDPPPEIEIPIDPEEPPQADIPGGPTDPEVPGDPSTGIDKPNEPDELDDPDVPLADGPKLPQTGQLWWPVLPMAVAGLTLVALGWKRRRDWSASDEA